MTPAKLTELRDRMVNHDVDGDRAIVKLSAKELQELLDEIFLWHRRWNMVKKIVEDQAAVGMRNTEDDALQTLNLMLALEKRVP